MKTARFDIVIGTGGIGTGILFELEGNRPLSRNETRLARLSPTQDYCKQHIILHYIARILAPEVQVFPIGMVGTDRAGNMLLEQMQEAGMDVRFVGQSSRKPTMYCVCMQYPDKAVCNVTTSESACAMVDRDYVENALNALERPLDTGTLVVSVPEVPLDARLTLLKRGKAAGAYCVSSCLVDEFAAFTAGGGMRWTDLLVINEDEAAAFCGCNSENMELRAMQCQAALLRENPKARLIMTCGAQGSYVCEKGRIARLPAQAANVVSTGGAGDAYTAGVVCGLALGLDFMPGNGKISAPELGAALSAEAISVADTIAKHIDRNTALHYLKMKSGWYANDQKRVSLGQT